MNKINELWIIQDVIRPFLDIAILTVLIYQIYKVLMQTRAIQLLKGALIIVLLYLTALFLHLDTLLWILNRLTPIIMVIIAVVFQPELRNIFTRIGQRDWLNISSVENVHQLDTILNAAEVLAARKRGALMVFMRKIGLKNAVDTGTKLDSAISSSLILSIFGFDTPLHDGALIMESGRILAAGCFLPLSEQTSIRRSFGTRHRAALGLAEETDAVVLVVSEETGAISLAYDANLYYDLSMEQLRQSLTELLQSRDQALSDEEASFEG